MTTTKSGVLGTYNYTKYRKKGKEEKEKRERERKYLFGKERERKKKNYNSQYNKPIFQFFVTFLCMNEGLSYQGEERKSEWAQLIGTDDG